VRDRDGFGLLYVLALFHLVEMFESQYNISKVPLAEAKANVDKALVLLAEVIADDVIIKHRFDHFKFLLDLLFHRDWHLLDCQWPPILVLALEHLSAVAAASDVSVRYYGHRSYLYCLRGIIIFIWKRQPDFIQLLLSELWEFWGLHLLLFILFDRFLC
jgi:hypothetical protein